MATKKIKPVAGIFDFSGLESIESEWQGMPEYNQPNNGAFRQIVVEFDNDEDVEEFGKLIQQSLTEKTKSMWFPPRDRNDVVDLFWVSTIE
jgi:hypothetical protein